MRFILSLTLLVSGCAHVVKSGAKQSTATPATTQVFPVSAPPSAGSDVATAFPADYEEYYVGMIADYDDPTFAYRPGSLLVQTRPSRFRGAGPSEPMPMMIGRGPATTAGQANYHPDPTDTEIAALVVRSQRAVSALTEENERLLNQVQDLQKSTQATPAPLPAARAADNATAATERGDDADRLNLITPNRDYVIELDPNFFLTPSPTTNNPFVQLYQPPVAFRELALVIAAAVPGPTPSAVINDQPYSVGDRVEGLTVHRIEPDTVYLRKDAFLLACPVSEKTLKLRLP